MNKIEKLLSNPLAEFLGAERTEDLNEITHEALESIKEKIKQKLEVKCMAIAEEAISKVRVED